MAKRNLREPSGSSPLRSDGSYDGQTARLDRVSSGLFQGMLKKGDEDNGEVDDEEGTTVQSQIIATTTLNTEESFLRTQYL